VLWVAGAGMEPTLDDNGPALVDRDRTELINGAVFAWSTAERSLIGRAVRDKRSEKWKLAKDNFADSDLPPGAQVVWTGKSLLRDDWVPIHMVGT